MDRGYLSAMADYLVATVGDRTQAETVYETLKELGLETEEVNIFGDGYKTVADCATFDPTVVTQRQLKRLMVVILPLGFIGGVIFYQTFSIDFVPILGHLGNSAIAGLLGLGAGAMGGFFVGGGATLLLDNTASYGQRLAAGKYLIVVQSSDLKMRQAGRVLFNLRLENLESFERPY